MMKKLFNILILPYTLALLYLMFFGFGRTQFEDHIVRLFPLVSTFNFAEHSLLWSNLNSLLINVFGNFLMFVPFGFLGWTFPNLNNLKSILFSFLSVLIVVEALQYFSRRGVFDIDDIILNSLGVCFGFWLKRKIEKMHLPSSNRHLK